MKLKGNQSFTLFFTSIVLSYIFMDCSLIILKPIVIILNLYLTFQIHSKIIFFIDRLNITVMYYFWLYGVSIWKFPTLKIFLPVNNMKNQKDTSIYFSRKTLGASYNYFCHFRQLLVKNNKLRYNWKEN